jgi:hypothetical protein
MIMLVFHISRKRIIAQGTNGCSPRLLMEGVMAGVDMLTFVDFAHSGLDHHPPLLEWVRSWMGCPPLDPLIPEGRFEEGHGITGGELNGRGAWILVHCRKDQTFLWALPPAVANAAIEELLKSRHKRMNMVHVVLIPRLMMPRW